MNKALVIVLLLVLFSCKTEKKEQLPRLQTEGPSLIAHAKGFSIRKSGHITLLKVTSPWPGADKGYTYALVPKDKMAQTTLDRDAYDAIVTVPVEKIVVTSTTHIPSLEVLGVGDRLVGFPNTALISSKATRKRIESGQVKELGNNESINTEMLIELNPDVVVGFAINDQNKAYQTVKRSNIPVVYNGDWAEESPLGKAEWIKFFAPFFGLEKKADSLFAGIEKEYAQAKELAANATEKPTVLTGGLYKDVWHVSGGKSWMAQFLEDAQAAYLWAGNNETGGVAVSLESVLAKAEKADFWLNPSMLTSYADMQDANRHYTRFEAFKKRKIYSNVIAKGDTGGLLYYELAPNRPDLVLKDLIHIFHPGLLPDYTPHFFKPLQ
ncbi:ABC transporter substrate-binding protein [Pseudozobellia thermophila]|uniref:Iron complex transport system substrate-binding protein n=1 Tax=Pseudozobellia thermophila TaxID=192903 RepID=A0A1M6FG39_9FLAO|nr:ABC transporter substrate-binding protein [Pseudozobellia thermophila]SHI96635.1 iron complex transport system substrate-binding protein [Pseudozobellia thermophila]